MKKLSNLVPAVLLALALSLTACSEVEPVEELVTEQQEKPAAKKNWTAAISASMSGASTKALTEDPGTHDLIATFETTDKIYVFNKTKNNIDSNPLNPDRSGANAMLTGTLSDTYSTYLGTYDAYAEDDELVLCYNSNNYGSFSYNKQKGTLATVADFAMTGITISAENVASKTITGSASFVNMQSIFGFHFTNGSETVAAKAVEITTDGHKLVQQYNVRASATVSTPSSYYGAVSIAADEPITETFYAALRNDNESDDIYHFLVNDGAGHLYSGEKSAPAGKIVNGKYYGANVTLAPVALPTVTLTESGTAVGPNAAWDPTIANSNWSGLMFGYANYEDITVSGESNGSWFAWYSFYDSIGDRTITLDGATITEPVSSHIPFQNMGGSFAFDLSGENTINSGSNPAIVYDDGTDHIILFKGNGTLTITSSAAVSTEGYLKGIKDGYYYQPSPIIQAADGYELTISDGIDNDDGTTTWVYTVRPEPEMVDLGLPSGTLWASYNLGVEDPTVDPYGNYYAWGETSQRSGDHSNWSNYKWGDGTNDYTCLTKYIIDDGHTYSGSIDNKTQLEPGDDAATVALGPAYCTPTEEDWLELWCGDYVTFTWTYINCVHPDFPDAYPDFSSKVYGYRIRSKSNSNSIFLPAAGIWKSKMSARGTTDSNCEYWSSTLYAFPDSYPYASEAYIFNADRISFTYESSLNNTVTADRHNGLPVRPVKHK